MLKLNHVSGRYELTDGYVYAVDDVNFYVDNNEILGIAGESGCGKSTLLKLMYDLISYPLEIYEGSIELDSQDGKVLKNGEICKNWWKDISYIPQGAMHVMNPVVKIKNQFLDTVNNKKVKVGKKQLKEEVVAYLNELDLSEEVLEAYPHQLSGGMRQRVLIGLATFLNPPIILADEPTTALDVVVQKEILVMLKKVQMKKKNSIVIVSHDLGVHYQIADRLGIMYAGQMIEIGPTDELFENAKHPYTKMLIDSLPRVGDASQKEGIVGIPPGLKNPPKGCRFAPRCTKAMDICKAEKPCTYQIGAKHMASCHLLDGYDVAK